MLLSGVVRNRKELKVSSLSIRQNDSFPNDFGSASPPRFWDYFNASALLKSFTLRIHKFTFKWDLVWHLSVCMLSLVPYAFSGHHGLVILPLGVWIFYNLLFIVGNRRANLLIPGFGRMKHSFKQSVEDLLVSPRLMPVLSISFLLVTLSLSVTGRRLGGPPLCYSSCGHCLSQWSHSEILSPGEVVPAEFDRSGCGYRNGKEMLSYYTIAQTSFLQFATVIIALAACMAWRMAEEESAERQDAEEWLKREDAKAFRLREDIMKKLGAPGSAIRPEGNPVWVAFGIVSALTFTLLGWHNWYILPPSHTATLLIILNLLTILTSSMILHLGFFGRLLALYKRNLLRVKSLTEHLQQIDVTQVDVWWNCRNFILNEDLALDYDTAGLAVSATFLLGVLVFIVLLSQLFREGFQAMMEPPGSYCAYAVLYITMCLMKIFSIATDTFQEQMKHINGLQALTIGLIQRAQSFSNPNEGPSLFRTPSMDFEAENYDYGYDIDAITPKPYHVPQSPKQTLQSSSSTSSAFGANAFGGIITNSSNNPQMSVSFASGDSGEGILAVGHSHLPDISELPGNLLVGNAPLGSGSSGNSASGLSIIRNLTVNTSSTLTSSSKDRNEPGSQSSPNPAVVPPSPSLSNLRGIVKSISYALLQAPSALLLKQPDGDLHPDLYADIENANLDVRFAGMTADESTNDNHDAASDVNDEHGSGVGDDEFGGEENNGHDATTDQAVSFSLQIPGDDAQPSRLSGRSPRPSRNQALLANANTNESRRQTLAEMVSQIRKYDPYPCILGIPVMPALFVTCKFYIFISFVLIGSRTMVACFHQLL